MQLITGAILIGLLALSLAIHEAAHAWVAYRCGDTTARDLGRLTLNPMVHIDPFMTILLPAILWFSGGFIFGGAKPVPVNPYNLRHPARDMMFVALAGPISNVLQAIVFMLVQKTVGYFDWYPNDSLMMRALGWGVWFNLLLAVFNMIPIPPLDGSRVMAFFLPGSVRESYVSIERFGILIVIAVVFFVPGMREVMFSAMQWLLNVLWELTGGSWT